MTPQESLSRECYKAHVALATRECLSSSVFVEAFRCNGGDFGKACSAALCTLGGIHAPIKDCYRFLGEPINGLFKLEPDTTLEIKMVPGWGSDFVKEKSDPELFDWIVALKEADDDLFQRIHHTTELLHHNGKKIFPNAACLTAATAIVLGYSESTAEYLLINPRMSVWSGLANQNHVQKEDDNIPS